MSLVFHVKRNLEQRAGGRHTRHGQRIPACGPSAEPIRPTALVPAAEGRHARCVASSMTEATRRFPIPASLRSVIRPSRSTAASADKAPPRSADKPGKAYRQALGASDQRHHTTGSHTDDESTHADEPCHLIKHRSVL